MIMTIPGPPCPACGWKDHSHAIDCPVLAKAREDGVAGLVADTPAQRQRLLARMAGNIAAGIATTPEMRDLFGVADGTSFPGMPSPEWVASRAVAIARAILDELDSAEAGKR